MMRSPSCSPRRERRWPTVRSRTSRSARRRARAGDAHGGVNVGLGTDGAATNNDLDMFDELRTAALIHKGVNGDPTLLPAEEAFALATINGARAVGLGDQPGLSRWANWRIWPYLDLDGAHVTPVYNLYSHLLLRRGQARRARCLYPRTPGHGRPRAAHPLTRPGSR